MAERRMFSSAVICSDRFIQLPHPTQNLYFHLCMIADDDGLVDRVQMTLRQLGLRPRHLQQLVQEGYVVMFDSGVLGIPHWLVHNQIRKDRYCLTYENQYFEIDVYPFWQDKAIAEIELSDENTPIVFPDYIKIIREVTDDPAYKNANLAASVR